MADKKRLIDANAFLSSMIKRFKCVPLIGRNDYDCESLKQMLIEAPTVDAVEVVHGEWVVCGDGEYVPFMCSACGKTTSWYHAQTANYCPNCGAKMRGDNE